MRILVAGGAGFIGSCFIRRYLARHDACYVICFDKLTYAGNLDNLRDVEDDPRYRFVQGDICDREAVRDACRGVDAVVNFAAETHVDRSIASPDDFIRTDVIGTQTLLEVARDLGVERFVQVSTDEVYGSIDEGSFTEESPLDPSSPYSASKAGGDLLAIAYHRTFGVPVMITRGSNTYGPYQYPEKLIPLFVTNAIEGLKLPLYGDGLNIRDWLHVEDHSDGIETVLDHGQPGEVYNIAGDNERTNREVTEIVLDEMGLSWDEMVEFVADRPGHDRRYSMSADKLRSLGWAPRVPFEEGLRATVRWYRDNEWWWGKIKRGEGEFAQWRRRWYEERG